MDRLLALLSDAFQNGPYGALTSAGTILLAAATFYLGLKTRDLATRTTEELDLLRTQAKAADASLNLQQRTLEMAERDRREARRPLLSWERAGGNTQWVDGRRQSLTQLVLRNHGGDVFVDRFVLSDATFPIDGELTRTFGQLVGREEAASCDLRGWPFEGEHITKTQSVLITAYAQSLLPGSLCETFRLRLEAVPGSEGFALKLAEQA